MIVTKHRTSFVKLFLLSTLAAAVTAAAQPAAAHNSWRSGAPLPTAVWCPIVGVAGGQIYVVGGVDAFGNELANTQIYNPSIDTWSEGAPLPIPNCAGVTGTVNGILYVIGGYPYTNAVWAYNPKTNTWKSRAPMPVARTDMGAAVLNGIIYVIGGNTATGNRITTVESYNSATNTWAELAPLPNGKSEPTVALAGNTQTGFSVVAVDGYTIFGDTGDNETYNTATNFWNPDAPDPRPRNAACGGAVGNRVYVAGGYTGSGSALSTNEGFSVSTNTWRSVAAMPQPALFSGSAVYGGNLYCIGGSQAFASNVLNNVQIYQP